MMVLIPTEPLARVVINPLRAEWLVAPCIGLTIELSVKNSIMQARSDNSVSG